TCCKTACAGSCMSCAQPGSAGTCAPVAVGAPDPAGQCRDLGAASCGTDGVCDGTGACRRYSAGLTCQTSTCNGASMDLASRCDGIGACVPTATQSCMPFTCDPQAKACRTTCATDADCAAPNTCTNGSCGKKPLGSACAAADQCNSGFCEQGTCCGSACDGICQSCGLPGTSGTCATVPAGEDPLGQCADNGWSSCNTDGTCDGAGACRKYLAGTICTPATCSGGTESGTRRCDGVGNCLAGFTRTCAPFSCGGSGACLSSCATDGDCVAGFFCIGGACTKKATGTACGDLSECASGFCQQGVCCNTSCAGGCRSCNLPGFAGVCTSIPSGQDPLDQCPDSGLAGCGTDGVCDGAGSCRLYASGTVCGPGACSGGTQTVASRCNGLGACVAGTQQACAPYVCGAGGGCLASCGASSDCSAGNVCVSGSCGLKANGATCSGGTECSSGICAQGICCGSACTGLCQSCAVAGSLGTCSAVPDGGRDPQSRCADGGAAACSTDGTCNGKGTCRLYNSSTVCAATSCSGSILTLARSCDGTGTCTAATTVDCQAYQCDPATNTCRTQCAKDTECTAPNLCIGGVCRKKDLAAGCTADNQCASGFCQQGVCCSSLCSGGCRSCALAGSAGACTNVPAQGSSNGVCPNDGAASCKHDGLCDGQGNCELFAAGVVCGAASCSNATAVGVSTCNGVGSCVAGASTSCKPYACGSNGACKTSCGANADCTSPSFCQAPVCNGGKANGQVCGAGSDCASTFCSPQGVCCDTACTGTCLSCTLGGSVGTCKSVPAGQAPAVAGQCSDQGATSCGTDGTCDGSGACRYYAGGTTCVAAACSSGTFTPARTCSTHVCQTVTAKPCGNYQCNASGCLTSCASNADCGGTSKCFSGACGGIKGQYFKNRTWSGTPSNIRVDPNVDFSFGNGSPFPTDSTWPVDSFTVRWSGMLTPRFTGQYFIHTLSDDGIAVYINGTAVIDHASVIGGNLQYTSAALNLTAGQPVTIRVDFFEDIQWSEAHVQWANIDETGSSTTFVAIPAARLTPDP
ncbi:MAG TPA: PA14 domain-containing protein, partial [Polyangia bacterium]|nr:PA14 domain-containing protein [Polyangia bacterium]